MVEQQWYNQDAVYTDDNPTRVCLQPLQLSFDSCSGQESSVKLLPLQGL